MQYLVNNPSIHHRREVKKVLGRLNDVGNVGGRLHLLNQAAKADGCLVQGYVELCDGLLEVVLHEVADLLYGVVEEELPVMHHILQLL